MVVPAVEAQVVLVAMVQLLVEQLLEATVRTVEPVMTLAPYPSVQVVAVAAAARWERIVPAVSAVRAALVFRPALPAQA
jgi:hypothetical protein